MRHAGSIMALSLVLVVAVGTGVVASGDRAASSLTLPQPMLSDLVIEPSELLENAYLCSATIVDPQTGETLSKPRVFFRSGEDAKIRTGVLLDGEKARLDVFISANGEEHSARIRVELVAEDGRTTVQTLEVRL